MSKPTPAAWTDQTELDALSKEPASLMWGKETADDLSRKQNKMIPLYLASDLQALEEENARLRETVKDRERKIEDRIVQIGELEARLKEALKVIEPFGTYLDKMPDLDNAGNPLPDEQGMGWVYLTIGDFRAARTLFTALQEKENTNADQ